MDDGQKTDTGSKNLDYGKCVPFLIQTGHITDADLGGEPDADPTCTDFHPQSRLHAGERQIDDVRLNRGDVKEQRNEYEQKEYAPDDASEPRQYTP